MLDVEPRWAFRARERGIQRADSGNVKARKPIAALSIAVLAALLASLLRDGLPQQRGRGIFNDPIDFIAFRCAGRVSLQAADPYRTEPLRSCEQATYAESRLTMVRYLVVPAPLPPYALVVFEPLALLPFRAAEMLWVSSLVGAFALSCLLLARTARAPAWLVAASLLPADLLASAVVGQLVPLVVCAMCASAAALRAKRFSLAAALAVATLLEPHLGLPLCAGLAWCEKRTRVPLSAGLIVLAAVSFSNGGLARNLEYARLVLPAHAAAEVMAFNAQYGLSALLVAVGVGTTIALMAGSASYMAMAIAGTFLGRRLATATGNLSFALFTPVATVLAGGPFLHIHQIAAALPLAFLLGGSRPWRSPLLLLAIVGLSIPWESVAEILPLASVSPHLVRHIAVDRILLGYEDGSRLAEDAWGAWVTAHPYDPRTRFEALLVKIPTWLALGLLLSIAVRRSARTPVVALTGPASPALRTSER